MYLLYTFLIVLALPIFVVRLFVKSWWMPAYRKRIGERFVIYRRARPVAFWIHAVSLGEVIAITPLIQRMQTTWPEKRIVLTTTTPTGSKKVQETFGDSLEHVYMPYDLPLLLNRFLKKWQPQVVLVMETEVWPNLLRVCHGKQIPTLLVNGRLSEKSFKNYQKWRWLFPGLFTYIHQIAAQSEADASRFRALGASSVIVTGSLKFDLSLPEALVAVASEPRLSEAPIFIAASTHPGEEAILLRIFARLRETFPQLRCILVPRHPERGREVERLVTSQAFTSALHSVKGAYDRSVDVYIVDTVGELLAFYALADLAFVGGSLVPHGGHNLIEPCALGKAVLSGPYVHNFSDLRRLLESSGATLYVQNEDELREALMKLLADPAQCQAMGKRALETVAAQRGSLVRQFQCVQELLSSITL